MSVKGAQGWAAIEGAFGALYPGQAPEHFGTVLPAMLGGKDPLPGISAYRSVRERPHWHIVTFGFSDLWDEAPAIGRGFELTMRLTRDTGPVPGWALNFLQNLARYVFDSGNLLAPGHCIDLQGPISLDDPTELHAVLLVRDPEMGTIEAPSGPVTFVQIVGVTLDELRAATRWTTDGVAAMLRDADPLLITDPRRSSIMQAPGAEAKVAAGIAAKGSGTGELFVSALRAEARDGTIRIMLGAIAVGPVLSALAGRLPFGKTLMIVGEPHAVMLKPGERCGTQATSFGAEVTLSGAGATELASVLQPVANSYVLAACPGLVIAVERSVITDGSGSIVHTIG